MVTRMLVLAMVLAITLVVTTPALSQPGPPIPVPKDGQQTFAINEKGVIFMGGDIVLGKCSDLLQHREEVRDYEKLGALRACEKAGYTAAGYTAPLSQTGGPPIILVPIAMLVVGGLLIRKATAL